MKSVGIDIGSHSIKIVEIDATSKGIAISRSQIIPLSQKPSQDQELEIIEVLRGVAATYDPEQTKFCVAVRQDQVTVSHKVFPFTEKIKIYKALPLELEDELPFDSENLIFDFKTVALRGPQSEVLAAAVPIHHIEKKLALLQDSNIDPELVSIDGMALANLVEHWNSPPPQLAPLQDVIEGAEDLTPPRPLNIIVHIGFTRTIVCAFENDNLVAVRSILWGAKNLADAISRKYELPFNDSLREMETKAFILLHKQDASFEAKIFSDTIAKCTRELVKDLQLSLLAIKSELNAVVTQIGLCGGPSHIQGLGPFITQHLEIPVNKLNLFDRFPQIQFDRSPQSDAILHVALGLAIEGLKKPRNPAINLLKGQFAKENTRFKNFFSKWKLGIQIATASFVAVVAWSMVRASLAEDLADKSQEALVTQGKAVAGLSRKAANESGVRKYIREKKKVISDSKALSSVMGMNSALEVLKKVNDAVPGKTEVNMDVMRFSVQDTQVNMEGYVNNTFERDQLKSRLEGLSTNKKITDSRSNLSPMAGRVAFNFTFSVDRNVQK